MHQDKPFILGGKIFSSRLIVGTGKYPDFETMRRCHEASGAEMVTVALGRVKLTGPDEENISPGKRDAIRVARDLIAKAERISPGANAEDAADLEALLKDLHSALERGSENNIREVSAEVEDLVFYLEDK